MSPISPLSESALFNAHLLQTPFGPVINLPDVVIVTKELPTIQVFVGPPATKNSAPDDLEG